MPATHRQFLLALSLFLGGLTFPACRAGAESCRAAGQPATLTAWQNPGTPAVTTWIYQPHTGRLHQKRDAGNLGLVFTYSPGGRLASRTAARLVNGQPLTTTYGYVKNLRETPLVEVHRKPEPCLPRHECGEPDNRCTSHREEKSAGAADAARTAVASALLRQ